MVLEQIEYYLQQSCGTDFLDQVSYCRNYVFYSPSKSAMEHGLHERDRVGLQDFILLEDYKSEHAFIDNLRKRFQENIIYVSNL